MTAPDFTAISELDAKLDAALSYASIGWRVFPLHNMDGERCSCGHSNCHNQGKHPRTERGFKDAATDAETIRAWWSKWPNANIGIATGPESGIVVIDVDPRHGGDDSWDNLLQQHSVPDTLMVGTGGGGHHAYFRWPDGDWRITIGSNSIAPGIDHRGDGGYVVAPPSDHESGRSYFWDVVEGDDLPELPTSIAQLIHKPEKTSEYSSNLPLAPDRNPPWWALLRRAGMTPEEIDTVSQQINESIEPHLARLYRPDGQRIPDRIIDGGRHEAAVQAAGLLRRGGVSDEVLAASIRALSRHRMAPPFGQGPNDKPDEEDEEVKNIVHSTRNWEADRVRWPTADPVGLADVIDGLSIQDAQDDQQIIAAMRRLGDGWPIFKARLEEHQWTPARIKAIVAIEQIARKHEEPPPPEDLDAPVDEAKLVAAHCKDAPTPPGAVMPDGWQIDNRGNLCRLKIRRTESGGETIDPITVTRSPIFILSRDLDLQTRSYRVTLAWRDQRRGVWQTCSAPRSSVMSSRKMPDLSDDGVPVTSECARDLVRWFYAYEAANIAIIPGNKITSRLGWHRDGEKLLGFLHGTQWIGGIGTINHDGDGGIGQLAQGLKVGGDRQLERDALAEAMRYPHVAAAIGASLAAPLLRIVGCRGFTFSLSGSSGRGKTSAQRMAAGIWCKPDEDSEESLLRMWDATRVGIVETTTRLDGIPFLLDDTSKAEKPYFIERAIYDVSSGASKLKGKRSGGTAASMGSRTVMISSGEAPIMSYSKQGGVQGRALEMWGEVWGGVSDDLRDVIDKLMWAINDNFGHTGLDWVTYLIQRRNKWIAWRDRWREKKRDIGYRMTAGKPRAMLATLGRLGDYVATIDATLRLVHNAGILECRESDIDQAVDELIFLSSTEATERDSATDALHLLIQTAISRRQELWSINERYDDRDRGPREWLGRWDRTGSTPTFAMFFDPAKIILEKRTFNPEGVFREWKTRDWIEPDKDGKVTKVVRFAGRRARMMKFNWEAVVDVLGYDPNESDQGELRP